jgi:hypothetical protein
MMTGRPTNSSSFPTEINFERHAVDYIYVWFFVVVVVVGFFFTLKFRRVNLLDFPFFLSSWDIFQKKRQPPLSRHGSLLKNRYYTPGAILLLHRRRRRHIEISETGVR